MWPRGAQAAGAKLPKELEMFLYEHIREEDFLHLLKASHEDERERAGDGWGGAPWRRVTRSLRRGSSFLHACM